MSDENIIRRKKIKTRLDICARQGVPEKRQSCSGPSVRRNISRKAAISVPTER